MDDNGSVVVLKASRSNSRERHEDAVAFVCGCKWRFNPPAKCPFHGMKRQVKIITMPSVADRYTLRRSA